MNALSPDLGMYVAEQTIMKRFKISDKEHRQLWNLAEFCKLEPEDSKRYQTYLSLQRYKINMAVVDIVLRGLTQEMRDFAIARYREEKSFHCISMELFVCEATLHKWNKFILQSIATMSSYNLTEEDIYRPNVVRNMIHLLDMRINTFCDTENLKYNQMWLDSLVDKRRRYRKLLETLMEIQAAFKTANKEDRDYVRYQVINEKIRHHHENVSLPCLQTSRCSFRRCCLGIIPYMAYPSASAGFPAEYSVCRRILWVHVSNNHCSTAE